LEVKQNNLISSLRIQPLIVVIRLENNFFDTKQKRDQLILNIKKITAYGIKHLEIGWHSNPRWIDLISEIKNNFKDINIGVASITSKQSLRSILSLDINYSMSPLFNKDIHLKAIEYDQLLIPGISNITDFKEAINLGYKIVKIFPASKLGINFLNNLKRIQTNNNIFFIGAGGIKSKDLKKLLNDGYDALAIGRELPNQMPDKNLKIWLKNFNHIASIKDF
tara:strand:+ start:86 stop:751 length:666 start_codon:yes stop_codon:yes gene_type:complete